MGQYVQERSVEGMMGLTADLTADHVVRGRDRPLTRICDYPSLSDSGDHSTRAKGRTSIDGLQAIGVCAVAVIWL